MSKDATTNKTPGTAGPNAPQGGSGSEKTSKWWRFKKAAKRERCEGASERRCCGEPSTCKCCSGACDCECCSVLCCKMRSRLECYVRKDTSSWRAPAFSSYAYLRDELKRLEAQFCHRACAGEEKSTCQEDAGKKITLKTAKGALDEALLAMTPARQLRCQSKRCRWCVSDPWTALKRFYSGSHVEDSWRALHRVQAALYTLYLPNELMPQAEHVEAVIAELPEQASLLRSATRLASEIDGGSAHKANATGQSPPTPPGTTLRGIYERAMDVSDNLQREARGLRNALMVASFVTFLVLVVLGVAHVAKENIIDLCITKAGSKMACPVGVSPHRFDVFAVELAGMLGGLLSIIIPLATGERIKTPYRVFNQQLAFKLLAGAASAVGGVLLIESGVIEAIKLDSTTAILGYAVVLGFAQQIATGAIDRTANSLAKQTPVAKSV